MGASPGRVASEHLLNASAVFERLGIEHPEQGVLAAAALVGRARRLVVALHVLLDAGLRLEAHVMTRVLLEYAILLKWFALDPSHHIGLWLQRDLAQTLLMDRELTEMGEELLTPETRADYEELCNRLRDEHGTTLPNAKAQADASGMGFAYSLLYRGDSKSGVHPSSLAAESLITAAGSDRFEITQEPRDEWAYPDLEPVAAALLLAVLEAAQSIIPALNLDLSSGATLVAALASSADLKEDEQG